MEVKQQKKEILVIPELTDTQLLMITIKYKINKEEIKEIIKYLIDLINAQIKIENNSEINIEDIKNFIQLVRKIKKPETISEPKYEEILFALLGTRNKDLTVPFLSTCLVFSYLFENLKL